MTESHDTTDTLFEVLALARLRQVDRAATHVADALGLAADDKYAVLSAMLDTASPAAPLDDEASSRSLVQHLADGFLTQYIDADARVAFDELWPAIERTPLQALADFYGHLDLDESELPNIPAYQTALALISFVSWAVLRSRGADAQSVSILSEREIIDEAESRGCPPELSRSLAQYLSSTVLVHPPSTDDEAANETQVKNDIYRLVHGFLVTHVQTDLARFESTWRSLVAMPVQVFTSGLAQPRGAAAGLGFASQSDTLLPIIAVVSSAVLRHASGELQLPSEGAAESIVHEAEAYGCPVGLSHALARYLRLQYG